MHQNTLEKPLLNSQKPARRFQDGSWLRPFAPLISIVLILVVWQLATMLKIYPPFIIPPPQSVLVKFLDVLADGTLWIHTHTTLGAVFAGLGFGLAAGIALGYFIAKSRFLDSLLSPLIVSFQSVPVVAYAPLLVIWFGSGTTSKIVTSALIVFFPMLLNTIVGIRNVPSSLGDLMRSMRATRWQLFTKLEVPAALPVLIGGLKISATLAVIGAVVGEFVSANAGLGFLINLARSQYDTPLVIVAVLTLTVIARLLFTLVSVSETYLLRWQRQSISN